MYYIAYTETEAHIAGIGTTPIEAEQDAARESGADPDSFEVRAATEALYREIQYIGAVSWGVRQDGTACTLEEERDETERLASADAARKGMVIK